MDSHTPKTAYPETHEAFASSLKDASFNSASFRRPLPMCDINECGGMCCYDGVYVNGEEERVLTRLASDSAAFFASVGAPVPTNPIIDAAWMGTSGGRKTAVVANNFREKISEYPAHFDSTACVFLTPEGRCSLQLLAEQERKERWYYKPIVCVLHPIRVSLQDKIIDLPSRETDPHNQPNYPGYSSVTHCGSCSRAGQPASEVLRPELEYLSKILGRDLIAELK